MASQSIRALVKARLVELIASAVGDIQVSYGFPAEPADEFIYVGRTFGTVTMRDMKAGRKARDDTFTVEIVYQAERPGQTAQQADERIIALHALVDDAIANSGNNLGGMDGLQWLAPLDNAFNIDDPEPLAEGYGGFGTAQYQAKTFLN